MIGITEHVVGGGHDFLISKRHVDIIIPHNIHQSGLGKPDGEDAPKL
jgi:hypothetical protein